MVGLWAPSPCNRFRILYTQQPWEKGPGLRRPPATLTKPILPTRVIPCPTWKHTLFMFCRSFTRRHTPTTEAENFVFYFILRSQPFFGVKGQATYYSNNPLDNPSLKTVDPTSSPIFEGPPLYWEPCVISVVYARFALTGDWSIVVYLYTLLLTALLGHNL